MKKTLALILAMILAASVALVSCENKENNIGDDNDDGGFVVDFDDFGETEAPETDENGETIVPETNNNNNNNNNNTTTMETVSDTVYVLYSAKIRETAKDTGKVVTTVPFGAQLSRTGKNKNWSKVTYNNGTTTYEGYIMNDLVTLNVDTVTFEDKGVAGEGEGAATVYPTSKLVGTTNYRLRHYPLADGYPHSLGLLDSNDLGEVGQVKGGDEVVILAVSKDGMWAKVSSTKVDIAVNGEYKKNYTSSATGYIPYTFLEAGANAGPGTSGDGPTVG